MMRFLLIFWFYGFAQSFITAQQVKPLPGTELNYNQVMLEHPVNAAATEYIIQVAEDSSFARPLIVVRDSLNATMVSNLEFGRSYLWRYCSIVKNKPAAWYGPYLFKILPGPYRDVRVHVLQNDSINNAGGLVLVDEFHCIYDREGKLVWFMPEVKSGFRKDAETYDMRLTAAGTITVLTGENGVELDLSGKMLWMTPFAKNDSVLSQMGTFYNHELRRLPNNNYMVIGRKLKWKKIPGDYDIYKVPFYLDTSTWHSVILPDGKPAFVQLAGFFLRKEADGIYMLINMADIIEYDKDDSVEWRWEADDYLSAEDILPNGANLLSGIRAQEPRLNGFCVDAADKFVYASFRNLDRVIKIDKASGKVVYSWGTKMRSGEAVDGAGFFRKQHAPVVMNDGNLVVFNNADMNVDSEPASVVMFSQPVPGAKSRVIWKFDCLFDSVMLKNKSTRAGSVDVLPNRNFLVSMGGTNRVFEVTPEKKIVWNALLERKPDTSEHWFPRPVYRTHYTSSLYPCYFTIQADCDTVTGSHKDFTLIINNAGSEADSYKVSVASSAKHYKHDFISEAVEKGKRIRISINPIAKPAHGEHIEILVKSNNNPDFERRLKLVVN